MTPVVSVTYSLDFELMGERLPLGSDPELELCMVSQQRL
jgi:hypothetical protein